MTPVEFIWMLVAEPPTAVITPPDAVIVEPSTLHRPNTDEDVSWIAGAASERMKVAAEPFTAVLLAVALGLAPIGATVLLIWVSVY
jgi:hypothetical protein